MEKNDFDWNSKNNLDLNDIYETVGKEKYESIHGFSIIGKNKAGYTAQDAPSKRTFHLRK